MDVVRPQSIKCYFIIRWIGNYNDGGSMPPLKFAATRGFAQNFKVLLGSSIERRVLACSEFLYVLVSNFQIHETRFIVSFRLCRAL